MTTNPAMPELPEPELGYIETNKSRQPAFSARQMRAAMQAQPAAVSDEQILIEAARHLGEMHVENCGLDDIKAFARAILALRPQAVPMTDELEQEDFALFSQTQVAALLWVLWCHQGASSAIGQPIRFALGMGKRQALTDEQVSAAQRFRIDWHQWCGITQRAGAAHQPNKEPR